MIPLKPAPVAGFSVYNGLLTKALTSKLLSNALPISSKSGVSNIEQNSGLTNFTDLPFLKIKALVILTPVRYNGGQLYIRSRKVHSKPPNLY